MAVMVMRRIKRERRGEERRGEDSSEGKATDLGHMIEGVSCSTAGDSSGSCYLSWFVRSSSPMTPLAPPSLSTRASVSLCCSLCGGTFSANASYEENLSFLKEVLEEIGSRMVRGTPLTPLNPPPPLLLPPSKQTRLAALPLCRLGCPA